MEIADVKSIARDSINWSIGLSIVLILLGMAALILLPLLGAASWLIHAIGLLLMVGRFAHAQGLHGKQGASPGRAIGMVCTWLSLLLGALALLWKALT